MKNIYTLIFLLSCSILSAQQENQFTQFMYNQLAINPAYAGARGMASLQVLYRNQWVGFKKAPTTKLLSVNAPVSGGKVGIGFTLQNHTHGIYNLWDASFAYCYKLKLGAKSSFRFGVQGNVRQTSLDFTDPSVRVQDNGDPSIIEDGKQSKINGNFGAGIYLDFNKTYISVSVPHTYPNELGINPSSRVVAKEIPHMYGMIGTLIPVSQKIDIKPAVLVKYTENAPLDFDFNLSFVFNKKFTIGSSYRYGGDGQGESIDANILLQYGSLAFGVAYDYGLSNLKDYNDGSIEALIRYDFLKERGDIENPRFFF